ncbi:PhzF family phenazine biosynthesis protein [Pelagibacterium xiamenense]|uniref:PhzF family phenazine biosynthesis protein n=1 Tax=Pelagibacterium xiamenense TaxID=2901140 RepID=UPI001E41DBD8|nr:PhzF family phenazine biosynthesis protein [Pelagibacterium xiamenense]MCD7060070.1 PhzF family phenazine biosynthesis protein [Pelagibacterium xiamenense]
MKLSYFLLDVFTRDRLCGNPLAVVLKADGLSTARMQAIAGEFNLSETVFVREPRNERHTAALRIFTARTELPFAGHPTIGTSVLLGLQNRLSAVRLELGVGLVTAVMERVDKRTGDAKFSLPQLPERIGEAPCAADIAKRLGIGESDIGCGGLQPAQYSAGLPFYLIPVRDTRVLEAIALDRRGWDATFPGDHNNAYVFTETPEERGNAYAARMFGVGSGVDEDPATGSAAAALIGLLAESGRYDDGFHTVRLRQGREMGRPSLIELQINIENGRLRHPGIGGSAVVLGEGVLDLSE